ncbi:MAG: thioredoxin family protein [Alphaproteobacteria bacterium]|nr:thioredoxin family protein [Alphaproteobacteria bacterium]
MIARRDFIAGLALGIVGMRAVAAPAAPFAAASFRAAQAADKGILVDITAPWCPVCKIQKPILAQLLASPRYEEILAFEVDFDRQKDALRLVDARIQSTLIVFRGRDELGRTVGDTNPKSIELLLAMAL